MFEGVGPGLIVGMALTVMAFVVVLLFYTAELEINNDHAADRVAIMQMVDSYGDQAKDASPSMVEERKHLAQKILDVKAGMKGMGTGSLLDLSDSQKKLLAEVAKTGKPIPPLDTHQFYWKDFWHTYTYALPWILVWVFLGMCATVNWYMQFADGGDHRLVDLPWRRKWPWMLTIVLGPICWLSMLFSMFNLVILDLPARREPERDPEPEPLFWAAYDEDERNELPARDDPWEEPRVDPTVTVSLPDYDSEPREARTVYVTTSAGADEANRTRAIAEANNALNRARQCATDLATRIKEAHGEIRSARKRLDDLNNRPTHVPNPLLAGEEFDRIMLLPGVIAVQVLSDSMLRFIIRATLEYEGNTYDLGDWKVDIGGTTRAINAYHVRNGVHPRWSGSYPVYRHEFGRFCFGGRTSIISGHLAKGEYLEAMALVVECLGTVNEEDREKIPYAFRRMELPAQPDTEEEEAQS